MSPKKKMAFLIISASNAVPVLTPRHTWLELPVVKDCFWDKALNEPIEEVLRLGIAAQSPPTVVHSWTTRSTGHSFATIVRAKAR